MRGPFITAAGNAPAPVITVGPTWTDNADGTATVTWATDIASDSVLNVGYSADYLEFQVIDASVVTSHSVTFANANGTYHFVVTDTAEDYVSADDTGDITGAIDTTVAYSQTDLAAAWFGFFDDVTSGRRNWLSQRTTLTFYALGSSATIRCTASATQPFSVSVDDGAVTSPVTTGSNPNRIATLFTGLSDEWHLVRITSNLIYDPTNCATDLTGTVISVTGGFPRVSQRYLGGNGYMVTDPSLPGQSIYATTAAIGGNRLPAFRETSVIIPAGSTTYSYGGSVVIRAKCTDLWIYTGEDSGQYAIDGGAWVNTNFSANFSTTRQWKRIATGLDGTAFHDYAVMGRRKVGQTGSYLPVQGIMAGNTVATVAYETPATRTKFIQFGDSITLGQNTASQYTGNGDTYIAAQEAGALAMMSGLAGATVANLDTALTSMLDGRWPSADVAVLAIGRNNLATPEATFKASYDSCIGKILAYGYTKVICRGIIPDQAGTFAAMNGWIDDVVTARADPDVVYLDTTGWIDIGTIENPPYSGTHPTDAGYVTMAAYEQPTYNAYS